jgi:two-component system, OmpR family, phosphate regulon sensor histidine kinase PhoR
MIINDLQKLATLLDQESDVLLEGWRQQVRQLPSACQLDVPTLNDHLPGLLQELSAALRSVFDETIAESLGEGSSPAHGLQRVEDGFDILEVVAEYNILRGCIHDLADRNGLTLQGRPFHVINQVLDCAIGSAVQTFATQRALEVQRRREEYLTFVAHDLRTPLNAISLAVRILERQRSDPAMQMDSEQVLTTLERNVRHLEDLVGKVLEESSNLQTELGVKMQRRSLDLWPLVEMLIHDLHPVAGTDSTALINEVPGNLVVYADASLLKRVFQNLIGNAIKYTPRGRVTIGAQVVRDDATVQCWVSDDGAGIPHELIDRVFDKGETDPDHVGGTGFGLAIVKAFIEAHSGTVTVESEENRGSTFRFSLPAKAGIDND